MSRRKVLIAGATGLVGSALLDGLLADDTVAEVYSLGRRAPRLAHPKLSTLIVDFASLPPLPAVDEVYLALGTTIKAAGSQAAFRALDHDATLAIATAARTAGATRAGLVSAMGADPGSVVFYNRVKGDVEQAVRALPWSGLVIVRPSLLQGDRRALGQPERPGERYGMRLGRMLGPLIPANYRPIPAREVAAALLQRVPRATGERLLLSAEMHDAR